MTELMLLTLPILCFVISIIYGIVNLWRSSRDSAKVTTDTYRYDITYNQMQEAEKRVSIFLAENDMQPGHDIQRIGEALHIYVSNSAGGTLAVSGQNNLAVSGQTDLCCLNDNGNTVVMLQEGATKREQRLTIARVCGYAINGDMVPAGRSDGEHTKEATQLANYVAVALLMPVDEIHEYLLRKDYQSVSTKDQAEILNVLCAWYDVDIAIAEKRIHDVCVLKEYTKK